jgi:benzoate/toluate 1,2-dioxygenase alpha subunit
MPNYCTTSFDGANFTVVLYPPSRRLEPETTDAVKDERLPELLADLVLDRPQDGMFGVDRRLFTDAELFERELTRIFERQWLYVAHASQLPNVGDYFTTHIGRRSVLLTRHKDGKIRGFLNACAHRGTALCSNERGNKKVFTCPYHGWVYDAAGKNLDVKDRAAGGYPEQFTQRSRDLTPLARLQEYRGFIFGSLSADVPSLEEHLGAARPFIDLMVDQSPQGLEVLKGAATYRYRGNWKLQAENGIDAYHFTTVHQNYVMVLQRRAQQGEGKLRAGFDQRKWEAGNGCYDLGNGHAAIWLTFAAPENRPLWERRAEITERIGRERADWILKRQRNLLLYPNVQLMDQASTQIRVFRPISVDLTEVKIYCIAPKGESPQARERRIRQYEDFFNASGMATPDDLAVFQAAQMGCSADGDCPQGYERGMAHMVKGADAPAAALGLTPVSSGPNAQDETLFHGQYRQWAKLMGGR